jgi:hypothetical protein
MGPIYTTQIKAEGHQISAGHTQQVNPVFLAQKYDNFYQIDAPICPIYGSFLLPESFQPDFSYSRADGMDLPRLDLCFIPANDETYDPLNPMDGALVIHLPKGYLINASKLENSLLEIFPNIPQGLIITALFPNAEQFHGVFLNGEDESQEIRINIKNGRFYPEYIAGINEDIDNQLGMSLSHIISLLRDDLELAQNWPLYEEMHAPSTASDLDLLLPEPSTVSTALLLLLLGTGIPSLVGVVNKIIKDKQVAQSTNGVASPPDSKAKK